MLSFLKTGNAVLVCNKKNVLRQILQLFHPICHCQILTGVLHLIFQTAVLRRYRQITYNQILSKTDDTFMTWAKFYLFSYRRELMSISYTPDTLHYIQTKKVLKLIYWFYFLHTSSFCLLPWQHMHMLAHLNCEHIASDLIFWMHCSSSNMCSETITYL